VRDDGRFERDDGPARAHGVFDLRVEREDFGDVG
jgi:hypothetical protein